MIVYGADKGTLPSLKGWKSGICIGTYLPIRPQPLPISMKIRALFLDFLWPCISGQYNLSFRTSMKQSPECEPIILSIEKGKKKSSSSKQHLCIF